MATHCRYYDSYLAHICCRRYQHADQQSDIHRCQRLSTHVVHEFIHVHGLSDMCRHMVVGGLVLSQLLCL